MTAKNKEWIEVLQRFTDRNAGRITNLEIDDPEIGAQWAETELPLLGVAYDPRDDRVEIMVGEFTEPDSHLTHTVAHPESIDVLTTTDGCDQALRVLGGGGQTLLRVR